MVHFAFFSSSLLASLSFLFLASGKTGDTRMDSVFFLQPLYDFTTLRYATRHLDAETSQPPGTRSAREMWYHLPPCLLHYDIFGSYSTCRFFPFAHPPIALGDGPQPTHMASLLRMKRRQKEQQKRRRRRRAHSLAVRWPCAGLA